MTTIKERYESFESLHLHKHIKDIGDYDALQFIEEDLPVLMDKIDELYESCGICNYEIYPDDKCRCSQTGIR